MCVCVCLLYQCKWLGVVQWSPIPQQRSHVRVVQWLAGQTPPETFLAFWKLKATTGQRPPSSSSHGEPPSPVDINGVQAYSTAYRSNSRITPSNEVTQTRTRLNLVVGHALTKVPVVQLFVPGTNISSSSLGTAALLNLNMSVPDCFFFVPAPVRRSPISS